jgi:methionyl-tRNA formyltransferase
MALSVDEATYENWETIRLFEVLGVPYVGENIEMRIILITQSDPFYLAKSIDYLAENMPKYARIVGAVVSDFSPYSKKESVTKFAWRTLRTFGGRFSLFYLCKFLLNSLCSKNNIKKVLEKHAIPTINLRKSINHPESIFLLSSFEPGLLVSIASNKIFKKSLIDLAPKGCINLHTGLLPKYRGLMPTFWVLKNQEEITGVSVFFVDEGIDSGPIIVQKEIKIQNMSHAELIKKSKLVGMDAIVEAIEKINQGNFELIPNRDDEMTYYSFPKRNDVKDFINKGNRFF